MGSAVTLARYSQVNKRDKENEHCYPRGKMHHKKLKLQSVTFCALQRHQKGLHVVPPHYCWLNVGGNVTNRAPCMKCQPGLTGLAFLTGSFVSTCHRVMVMWGGQEQVQHFWVDFWNRRGKRCGNIEDNVFYRTISSDLSVLDQVRSMP